nr:MAG TPA: hypothetical protein [Crassvirales sp.]
MVADVQVFQINLYAVFTFPLVHILIFWRTPPLYVLA